MNRLLKSIVLLSFLALSAFAEDASKVKFLGLDGGFIKFGGMTGGYRQFEVKVDYDPFHFVAKGLVSAGAQTEDLDINSDKVGVAVSYFDSPFTDSRGIEQMAAINEVIIMVEDEPAKTKDVKIELLAPANEPKGRTIFASVPGLLAAYAGSVSAGYRAEQEDGMITSALADPWSKDAKDKEIKAKAANALKERQLGDEREQASTKARQDSLAELKRAKAKKAAVVVAQPAPSVDAPEQEATPVVATANEEGSSVVPTRKGKKRAILTPTVEEEPEPAVTQATTEAANASKQGIMGTKDSRKKLGIGLAVVGGIFAAYGIIEHSGFNNKLNDMQAMEANPASIVANPGHYADLDNEKKGYETRRNLGLIMAVLCIGGSIVMFRF